MLKFIITFMLCCTLQSAAPSNALMTYWRSPHLFVVHYGYLSLRDKLLKDRSACLEEWRNSLRKAKEQGAEGVVAPVQEDWLRYPDIIPMWCVDLLDLCEQEGMKCVIAMEALEDATEDAPQTLWNKKNPESPTLNNITEACNNVVQACRDKPALAGYVLHSEPMYANTNTYIQACNTLIQSMRKHDPLVPVFVKGNESDMDQADNIISRIQDKYTIASGNFFATRNNRSPRGIEQHLAPVTSEYFFVAEVGHNKNRWTGSEEQRDTFYANVAKSCAKRGWSVALHGFGAVDTPHALGQNSLKHVKAALMQKNAC